jgi:RNA polymerase sigma factor for flagellar operon FliA
MVVPQDSDGQRLFSAHLEIIERVISFVCRRNHLTPEEAEDFGSAARLRLLADDCATLRQFRGDSRIQTFLSVTIERIFVDYRRQAWGKWRPSAAAIQLGPTAVLLDRLLTRDGYTVEQAYELITTNHKIAVTRAQIEEMAAALPQRYPRRLEGDKELLDRAADTPRVDQAVADREAVERIPQLATALRNAVRSLTVQDRLVLVMRFHDGKSVPQIAAALGLDQKMLYRRIERLLKDIRQHLESQGVDKSLVLDILGSERASSVLGQWLPEISSGRPSMDMGAGECR